MKIKVSFSIVIMLLGIVACTSAELPPFDTSELAILARENAQIAIAATQTSITNELSPLDFVQSADATNGEVLFNTFQADAGFACGTCHWIDTENQLIGPGLLNISQRASSRVEGQGAYDYIFTSITNPDAYVVESFNDTLMPENWNEIYSEDEINDIIAYLWTLNE